VGGTVTRPPRIRGPLRACCLAANATVLLTGTTGLIRTTTVARSHRLVRRRSRHGASAYEGQRHEHVEQPWVGIGVDVVELAFIEGHEEL
jgi:hypothetical protein